MKKCQGFSPRTIARVSQETVDTRWKSSVIRNKETAEVQLETREKLVSLRFQLISQDLIPILGQAPFQLYLSNLYAQPLR